MADQLVDLKYTKADQKEEQAEMKMPPTPEYAWGLQIRLEREELDKLGVKKLPSVGDEWHFNAVAEITGVSESHMASGKDECCVTLQIKMMGLDLEESADEEAGEKETPASEAAEARGGRSLLNKYGRQ